MLIQATAQAATAVLSQAATQGMLDVLTEHINHLFGRLTVMVSILVPLLGALNWIGSRRAVRSEMYDVMKEYVTEHNCDNRMKFLEKLADK